jgi:transaldolase
MTVLLNRGVRLNVTALFTVEQVKAVVKAARQSGALTPCILSVFAGRVADAGVDPHGHMRACWRAIGDNLRGVPREWGIDRFKLLWASPRQLYDIFLADSVGCDIITVGSDILDKLNLVGKDLTAYSLETVKQFYNDAQAAGYNIDVTR